MSPIHDQSYRRYAGVRQPPGRAWAVIAWTGIRSMLSRKAFMVFMVATWIPFIVFAVNIYRVAMLPQSAGFWPVDVKFFEQFVDFQGGIVTFFVTIWAGAGLIAADRRANALQIYLSKPLLRIEYIGGKLAVLCAYLIEVTLVPALLLLALQVGFSGSMSFIRTNPTVVPSVILACVVRIMVPAFTMLALSSLSKSSRYVAVLYTGAIFFTDAIYAFLAGITGSTRVAWVSISRNIEQVTDVIFRQTPRYETPTVVSALVLLGLVVVSISILERRVRGVEIVK